jgi:hypothetical protein
MPSQTRSLSRIKSSAAKKIQRRFKTRKRKRSIATRRIQRTYRGFKSRKLMKRVKTKIVEELDCSICHLPFNEEVPVGEKPKKIVTALPCGHRFHLDCIQEWLDISNGRCSSCKKKIKNIPYSSRQSPLQLPPQSPPQSPEINMQETIRALLGRMGDLVSLEEEIEQQRQLVIPSQITYADYDEALNILNEATSRFSRVRRLFDLGDYIYNHHPHFIRIGTPEVTDSERHQYLEGAEPDFINMYDRLTLLYHRARENIDNAQEIVNNIRYMMFD